MRRILDTIYDGAAWLAALAMIGVLLAVLASIVSRQLGINVPGTDAYAGYSMAAAGFLALAHTLKHNEHIRVTLILGRLKGVARHRLEMWALTAAVFLGGLFAFYSVRLAWQSHVINAAVDSADRYGPGHGGAADRVHRRMVARAARAASGRRKRGGASQ
jgi:TRAP-type C4-dicarboxylate transport system permease small subunit